MTTPTGNFDLRRLIAQSVDLSTLPSGKDNNHPIGFGVKDNHSFNLGSGQSKLRLPKAHEAAQAMRSEILENEIPGLSAELSELAWSALITKPSMVIPLARPSQEELLERGITLASDDLELVRAIGLGVVVRPNNTSLN